MQTTWRGHYLDGVTADPIPVTVIPTPHGFQILKPAGSDLWRYSEIQQTQGRYAGEPVRFEKGHDPAEVLVIPDASILTAVRRTAPEAAGRFHNPAVRVNRPWWITLAAVVSVVAGSGIYFWGIPAATDFLADRVPVAWEEKLGQTVVNNLVGSSPACDDPLAEKTIEQIVKRLDQAAPSHPYTFRVMLVTDPVVNAFAAPGGYIVVFSGLLEKSRQPEELAGVLAHEMQHVIRRHGTKAVFRDLSTSILIAALVGDTSGVTSAAMKGAKTLSGLSYSRKNEEEADTLGMEMIQKARIDPHGMVGFFETVQKEYGREPEFFRYFSTHPNTSDRIRRLSAMADRAAYKPVPLISTQRWRAVVGRCSSPKT
ncbi:MAG: M48 family metallopeptidase [Nitrospirae bacterium]|nr:M48 family metallopeptidase [Nitrospirota bacterium]